LYVNLVMELCSREEIECLIGMRVRNLTYYQEALLHKSAVKLYGAIRSNERLEFIGDSVLNLVIARYLFTMYPHENEGFMTKMRTRIVSGKCLSGIAKQMNLHRHIRMNEKALRQKWNENPRILEDAFESIIGAIYLDLGMFYAQEFIIKQLQTHVNFHELMIDTNYKDMLMRHTQSHNLPLPEYVLHNEDGPNHNKSFCIHVFINGVLRGVGTANTKKQAEQHAAYYALQVIS
jgi:ribonuclease-3